MLSKLRWHTAYQNSLEEKRACLADSSLIGRYRPLAASALGADRSSTSRLAWTPHP
ncbi:hypothetical protein SUDANB140_02508 [Streptomyces sp. enrichment culture]